MLVGQAIAHYRLLDLHGGVFIYRQVHPLGGIQDNAPSVGHGDAGGNVLAEKQLLDGHFVGPEPVDERLHILGDLHQTGSQWLARRRGNGPVLDHLLPAPLGFDDAEAHRSHTGVDA